MRKLSLLLVFLFMAGLQVVVAQTRLVTGNVTSAEDRSPVPGASVVVKGTTVGTVTDSDGNFSLNVPQNAQTLVISFVGMVTQEVPVSSQVRVLLESETQLIDEVISVAYGTAKKSSFTGSASSVSSEKLETRSVATITKALDGIVPGVQSTLGSGQPGDGASIVIRGFGSINASTSPLYVVDGVPYNGALNAINPNDIESITILKDASAGALYGSRGANGVVMITTKAGKDTSGKISTNFKASLGLSSRAIPRYNVMNQSEYLETAFLAFKHDEMFAKGIPEAQAG